jgi:hypothetical protein
LDDDRSATELIADARNRTLAAGSARVELLIDYTYTMPPMPRRRRGGLMRPVTAAAKAAGKRLLKAATNNFDFRHMTAEGVVDLEQRRYMLDYGSYARLYASGKEWDGRSGRRLSTLSIDEQLVPTPLWLLDILAGVTEATDDAPDEVRGRRCRRFTATVDLSRASQATAGGVAVPTLARFEDALALSVGVCIDGEHIRRVRFRPEHRIETLELWDFGVALDHLDWTRLPTFRSPEEAAAIAKARRRS